MSMPVLPPECPKLVETILARKSVTAKDVQGLRRKVFGDAVVSPDEAELLFTIHQGVNRHSPKWNAFFVEALTDYLVHQAKPRGYVSVENAVWLLERVMADGHVDTASELEAVVKILEAARSAPAQLSAFALMQVRKAILNGHGAARRLEGKKRKSAVGTVTEADVALLRRILYAGASDGGIGISRQEAAVLFDINDETHDAKNAPEWSELFVKAIGNAMLFASGHSVPSREDALRQEAFLESREGVAGFLTRMAQAVAQGQIGASESCVWEERLEAHKNAAQVAEALTGEEAEWLIDRIGRDGQFSDNERAAIGFILSEAATIHPALTPLIERVRAA